MVSCAARGVKRSFRQNGTSLTIALPPPERGWAARGCGGGALYVGCAAVVRVVFGRAGGSGDAATGSAVTGVGGVVTAATGVVVAVCVAVGGAAGGFAVSAGFTTVIVGPPESSALAASALLTAMPITTASAAAAATPRPMKSPFFDFGA